MHQKDYYKVLGVASNASVKEIKDAYRKLAFANHPDRNANDPSVIEKMKGINEAYAVLSNEKKRKEYDTIRQHYGSSAYNRFRQSYTDHDIFNGSDIYQVFEEMTRAFGFRGVDEVFREFYGPGYRSFEFRRPGVYGRGFIYTKHGGPGGRTRLRAPGRGPFGKISRLVIEKLSGVAVPEDGKDIHDTITILPEVALTGGPYAYFVKASGKKLIVKIPARVRSGQRIRLSGQGEKGNAGGRPGDLYLKVTIKEPLLSRVKNAVGQLFK
jgi:DnaJ-class molecular chaperone